MSPGANPGAMRTETLTKNKKNTLKKKRYETLHLALDHSPLIGGINKEEANGRGGHCFVNAPKKRIQPRNARIFLLAYVLPFIPVRIVKDTQPKCRGQLLQKLI